jgi:glycosyltransferase involved in cell wall biosynthesis
VGQFLQRKPDAHFLVVGDGPEREEIRNTCAAAGVADRLHLSAGKLEGQDLADAYAAMDVYAFASQSETQGIVLAEAMAAGAPVVAVDASGVRDIVRDGVNGRLLPGEDEQTFADALACLKQLSPADRARLQAGIDETAAEFSTERSIERLEQLYQNVLDAHPRDERDDTTWATLLRRVEEEWAIWLGHAKALGHAMTSEPEELTSR